MWGFPVSSTSGPQGPRCLVHVPHIVYVTVTSHDHLMLDVDRDDDLVSLVHAQYATCGFKPSNAYQYTVLAAFVLTSPSRAPKLVSLATGSKCLPQSRLPPLGDALHDSHAEVLARRGLIKWLYEEARACVVGRCASDWMAVRAGGKWGLQDDVRLNMYISTVPCEDAP